jgi:hypothetical protein
MLFSLNFFLKLHQNGSCFIHNRKKNHKKGIGDELRLEKQKNHIVFWKLVLNFFFA